MFGLSEARARRPRATDPDAWGFRRFSAQEPPTVEAPASRYPFAERLEGLRGLKNVGRITPRLYRGSAPTREGLETLKAMGIKTVVNLRHYHGKGGGEGAAVRWDLATSASSSSRATLPRTKPCAVFLRTVTDPALQPVYFHCWRGKDRTGAMAAVYRMTVDGWPLEAALAEMDAFGFYHGWHDLLAFVQGFPGPQGRVLAPGPRRAEVARRPRRNEHRRALADERHLPCTLRTERLSWPSSGLLGRAAGAHASAARPGSRRTSPSRTSPGCSRGSS